MNTLRALHQFGGPHSIDMDMEKFAQRPVFGMDLTPTFGDGFIYNDPHKVGNISFKVSFKPALPQSIIAYVYCQYSNRYTLDSTHMLHVDW